MYTLRVGDRLSPRTGGGKSLLEEEGLAQNINMSRPRTMPQSALLDNKHLPEGFGTVGSIALTQTNYEPVSAGRKQQNRRTEPISPTNKQPRNDHYSEPADRTRKSTPSPHGKTRQNPLSTLEYIKTTTGGRDSQFYSELGSQFHGDQAQTKASPPLAMDISMASLGYAEAPAQSRVKGYLNLDKIPSSSESLPESHQRTQKLPTFVQLSAMLKRAVTLLGLNLTECESEYDEEQHEPDYEDVIPESLCIEIEKQIRQNFLLLSGSALKKNPDVNSVITAGSDAPCDSPERSTSTAEPSAASSSGQREAGENWKGKQTQRSDEKSPEEYDGDSGGSGSGEPEGRKLITILNLENHELACPYNKLYPHKFCRGSEYNQKYQACSNSFKDTAALIQHFRERHYYSDRVCLRCHKQFRSKRTFEDHIFTESRCCCRPAQSIEDELPLLPRSDRRKRLDRVGKRKSGVSNEQQWCRIWNALFPGHECPDPYQRLNSLEREYDRAIDALIPGAVHDLLAIFPDLDIDVAQAHCRRLTDAIRDRLHPFFEASRGQSTESVDINNIPSVNVQNPSSPSYFADASPITLQGLEAQPLDQCYNLIPMNMGSNALGEAWNPYDAVVDNAWTLSQSDPQPQNDFSSLTGTSNPSVSRLPLWTVSGDPSYNYVDSNTYHYLPGATSAFRTPTQNMPGHRLSRRKVSFDKLMVNR